MGQLVIYKASAGSGKTFTLAVEYITLLIKSPENYRHILAVTFTNKATAEMKLRILSQLYGIGYSLESSKNYFEKIHQALPHFSEKKIRENAQIALNKILHDFTFFHVETIDSFFQTVMRNLAHELQLTNNLNIDLDSTSAIEEAVDKMLEQLTSECQEIKWIQEFIGENISDSKSWDIRKGLKTFSKNLFKEDYQNHSSEIEKKLSENEFAKQYKKTLQTIKNNALDPLLYNVQLFMDDFNNLQLSLDDFKGKGNSGINYFFKIQKGTLDDDNLLKSNTLKMMEDASSWAGSTGNQSVINENAEKWRQIMLKCEEIRKEAVRKITTCEAILKNYNELMLLNAIHGCLNDLCRETNRFLLADTPLLLNTLIKDSDAPFIFEKLGTQFHHLMIDEFQDTSRMQWNNFKSLLIECLSLGNSSLIVGDVKQSIYRWRSGDWSILSGMRKELPNANNIVEVPLDTNFRSLGNIIGFNNDFFLNAAALLQEQGGNVGLNESYTNKIALAYHDVAQSILPKNADKGLVKISLLQAGKDEDFDTLVLEKLTQTVEGMLCQGVPMTDIAILVRANKHIPTVAQYFSNHMPQVPIVSDEAFRLSASFAVNRIINALTLLQNPDDALAKYLLGELPEAFSQHLETLYMLPLYELIEQLIEIFSIHEMEKQESYLLYFLDEVMNYLRNNANDIPSFLKYWEEILQNKTIPAGQIQGVRILSIHKSKGLEYPNVIIPFCNWELSKYNDILWCPTTDPEINQLPIVPVSFGKSLKDSSFKDEYQDEMLQQWIDNLNLLYVAFTRPRDNMFVIGELKTKKENNKKDAKPVVGWNTVSDLIWHVLCEGESPSAEDDFVFVKGAFHQTEKKEEETSENPFDIHPIIEKVKMHSGRAKISFRQSGKSQQFIEKHQDITPEQIAQDFNLQQGLLLHRIFSTIRSEKDIEPTLHQLEFDGEIASAEKLRELIRKGLSNPQVKDWFLGNWKVTNECAILKKVGGKAQEKRPDRVMEKDGETVVVDFKFGKPKRSYLYQVQEYMQLLKEMGHTNVKGYLWFVYDNVVDEVK